MLKFLSFVALVLIAFGILTIAPQLFNEKSKQGSLEASSASWGDGTDAFYKQLLESNGEFLDNVGTAVFDNKLVSSISRKETEHILAQASRQQQVLGLHTAPDGVEKWVEIDLSDLKLFTWEGNRKIYEFSISTGRPGYKTPTGEFRVWSKVRSQTYKGGSKLRGDYYYLTNVPFSLFFGGGDIPNWKGYAIHGAYWHNDFGIKNRSSGCINLRIEDAGKLYLWAGPAMPEGVNTINATADNPGVRVVIHE